MPQSARGAPAKSLLPNRSCQIAPAKSLLPSRCCQIDEVVVGQAAAVADRAPNRYRPSDAPPLLPEATSDDR